MYDWDEARRAVDAAIADGAPLTTLLLVEYAAEPVAPNLFRKLSMFRLGDTYVAAHCVHEGNWLVKYGTKGIATPELYEDELRLIRDNPFEAALRPAFELAGIEYGRADFGLACGAKSEIRMRIEHQPAHEVSRPSPSPFSVSRATGCSGTNFLRRWVAWISRSCQTKLHDPNSDPCPLRPAGRERRHVNV